MAATLMLHLTEDREVKAELAKLPNGACSIGIRCDGVEVVYICDSETQARRFYRQIMEAMSELEATH